MKWVLLIIIIIIKACRLLLFFFECVCVCVCLKDKYFSLHTQLYCIFCIQESIEIYE